KQTIMFHFYCQAPNISDWFSLDLTVIGICLAIYALNQWRREKKYDILLEAKSRTDESYDYLFLRNFELGKFYLDNFSPSVENNRCLFLTEKLTERNFEFLKGTNQEILLLHK